MKKVNGFLIFIALISLALLGFIAYATGLIKLPEKKNNLPDSQTEYKNEYEADPTKNRELVCKVSENLFTASGPEEIYTVEYQKKVREGIDLLIGAGNFTEDNPLLILNPFGTNTQSLYVYFETEEPCIVSYTIHTDALESAAPDFGGYVTASTEEMRAEDGTVAIVGNSHIHEFAVNGLVPNERNIITFRLVNENSRVRERLIRFDFGNIVSEDEEQLTVEAGKIVTTDPVTGETTITNASDKNCTDGMFAVFSKQNDFAPYLKLYDNDGFIRGEIPLEKNYSENVYVKDGEIYVFVSDDKLVRINSFGEVTHIYKSNNFVFGKKWCIDDLGNMVLTASYKEGKDINDADRTTVRDLIVTIDFADGDIYCLADMTVLLSEYRDKYLAECIENKVEPENDWLGLSAIDYVGENKIVVTAETINSFIKIRRLYNNPRLVYIAGDSKQFEGTSLEQLCLRPDGTFRFETSAEFGFTSTVSEAGTYNYDLYREKPRHYLWALDRNLNYEYGKKEEKFGYFVKYLVDEEEMTIREAERIRRPEITESMRVFKFGDNLIYVDGLESKFYECDANYNLIASFEFVEPVVEKTIEEQDREEDNPPPDDSVIYVGISKFDMYDYFFTNDRVVYRSLEDEKKDNEAAAEEARTDADAFRDNILK